MKIPQIPKPVSIQKKQHKKLDKNWFYSSKLIKKIYPKIIHYSAKNVNKKR